MRYAGVMSHYRALATAYSAHDTISQEHHARARGAASSLLRALAEHITDETTHKAREMLSTFQLSDGKRVAESEHDELENLERTNEGWGIGFELRYKDLQLQCPISILTEEVDGINLRVLIGAERRPLVRTIGDGFARGFVEAFFELCAAAIPRAIGERDRKRTIVTV